MIPFLLLLIAVGIIVLVLIAILGIFNKMSNERFRNLGHIIYIYRIVNWMLWVLC